MYRMKLNITEDLNEEKGKETQSDEHDSVLGGTCRLLILVNRQQQFYAKCRSIQGERIVDPALRKIAIEVENFSASGKAIRMNNSGFR